MHITNCPFNLKSVDPSWYFAIENGLSAMDDHYLKQLASSHEWLPGPEKIFNAFSLPPAKVNYILFGESPYPRKASANGYAFWDADVHSLFSPTGLSKKVNRATSLRNILKMLLIAEGLLSPSDTSQEAIQSIPKNHLIQTNEELFTHFIQHGFLLLNTTPVLQASARQKDAKAWYPFMKEILQNLLSEQKSVILIMLGKISNIILPLIDQKKVKILCAEHPYNLSFVTNSKMINFFSSIHLLLK